LKIFFGEILEAINFVSLNIKKAGSLGRQSPYILRRGRRVLLILYLNPEYSKIK